MLVDLSGKLSVTCAGGCLLDGVEFVESGLLPETNKELQCSSLQSRAMPIPPFVDVGRLTTHRAEFILDQPEFEASALQCRCCRHDATLSVSAGKEHRLQVGQAGVPVGSSEFHRHDPGVQRWVGNAGCDRRHCHFVAAFRRVVTEPNAEQHRQRTEDDRGVAGTQPGKTVKHGNDKPPGAYARQSRFDHLSGYGTSGCVRWTSAQRKSSGRKHPTQTLWFVGHDAVHPEVEESLHLSRLIDRPHMDVHPPAVGVLNEATGHHR